MDIVIIFNNKEDMEHCRGFLYRRGASYETGAYKQAEYIVVTDASEAMEENFFAEDVFLEYVGEVKIGAFDRNHARACRFLTNCSRKDLPQAEDVYDDYCRHVAKREEPEASRGVDLFVYGSFEAALNDAVGMEEGLAEKIRQDVKCSLAAAPEDTIRCVFTSFNLGWNTKHICLLFLDGIDEAGNISLLAEEAIHAALWDYAEKHGIKIEGLEKPKSDIHEDEEEEAEEY